MSVGSGDVQIASPSGNTEFSDESNLKEFFEAAAPAAGQNNAHDGCKDPATLPENIADRGFAMQKRQSVDVADSGDTDLQSLQCCKRIKCSEACDLSYLKTKREVI